MGEGEKSSEMSASVSSSTQPIVHQLVLDMHCVVSTLLLLLQTAELTAVWASSTSSRRRSHKYAVCHFCKLSSQQRYEPILHPADTDCMSTLFVTFANFRANKQYEPILHPADTDCISTLFVTFANSRANSSMNQFCIQQTWTVSVWCLSLLPSAQPTAVWAT